MSNPKAEAIQRFHKRAFEHIEAFDKALSDYPTTQTFVIVVTNDPDVYNFVPKHRSPLHIRYCSFRDYRPSWVW